MDDRVGIRELRQDLSRYLRRVRSGERLTVTEHGRPVAVLSPWADRADPFDRLVAEGKLRRGSGMLTEVRPLARSISRDGTHALEEQREEPL
ncbi:MAG TPA: type II toxin-antitoxin system prevent-host-death family antitoxin [Gaiellaceae bacterium]